MGNGSGVTIDPDDWGVSLRLSASFTGDMALVSSARQLITELCAVYLEPSDRSAGLVMAAQELLENLAKYSLQGDASFDFELGAHDGPPTAKIRTSNAAAAEHLGQAVHLLERIASSVDPDALYDEWVATSGERDGSRLGLIRLRAEAGLRLTHRVDAGRLHIEVSGPVSPKWSAS